MKVLIDTNVILDLLCNRKGFSDNANQIFRLCEAGTIDGYISALTIPNIVYIMRKELDGAKIREVICLIESIFTICDLKASHLRAALELGISDYEDALQSMAASDIEADYIITRNISDFKNSNVKAISPSELVNIVAAHG